MGFTGRRSFVLLGVVAVACGGDSAADGGSDSTGGDSTQGDDIADDDVADDDDDDGPTSTPGSSDGASTDADDGVDTSATDGSSGPSGCVAHDECSDPLAPACIDGTCSPCNAAEAPACSEIDAALPVCGPDGGCVECTEDDASACTGNTPVCDVSTSSCIRCTEHAQCPDSACDVETGACFETDCVVDVDADGGGDYVDIASALEGETDDACVLRVHTPDSGGYPDTVQIIARKIALLGIDSEPPGAGSVDGGIQSFGGAVVYVSHMTFIGASHFDDSTLWVDGSDFFSAAGATLRATSDLSQIHLRNTWLHNVGPDPALHVDFGEVEAVYTTMLGTDIAVQCADAATTTMRNSFVATTEVSPAVACGSLDAEYSAFEDDMDGVGNVAVGEFMPEWIADMPVFPSRLSSDVPVSLATTARWTSGDPVVDIDGDPRPDRDGAMDFAGADVVVP